MIRNTACMQSLLDDLAQNPIVNVVLNPQYPGVIVPTHLYGTPQIMLQLGLDLPIPIRDLNVDIDGITGTLSFGGRGSLVVIPWGAVCGTYLPSDAAQRKAPRAAQAAMPKARPAWFRGVILGGRKDRDGAA